MSSGDDECSLFRQRHNTVKELCETSVLYVKVNQVLIKYSDQEDSDEIQMYNYLRDKGLVPRFRKYGKAILIDTTGMIPLREALENGMWRIVPLVYSLLDNLVKYNFVHGNLNLDNVLLYKDRLVVIELSRSYIVHGMVESQDLGDILNELKKFKTSKPSLCKKLSMRLSIG